MKHKTVLIIDDDPDEHLLIHETIKGCGGLPVFEFCLSALQALKNLDNGSAKPDLIVVDINMPRMSGIEFLKEIKSREDLRHIPVFIHSTAGDAETKKSCCELGAAAYLKKGLDHHSLLEAICATLGRTLSA